MSRVTGTVYCAISMHPTIREKPYRISPEVYQFRVYGTNVERFGLSMQILVPRIVLCPKTELEALPACGQVSYQVVSQDLRPRRRLPLPGVVAPDSVIGVDDFFVPRSSFA